VLGAGSELASSFVFPGRLGKAQGPLWEVPAAGCDFPEEVVSPEQMVLAQAMRQEGFGNGHCAMLTGADPGGTGRTGSEGRTEAGLHANPSADGVIGFLPSWVFCKYDAILASESCDITWAFSCPHGPRPAFFQAEGHVRRRKPTPRPGERH